MPNYPGLIVVAGDKIRFSEGCRQQAFSHSPIKVGIDEKNVVPLFNESILNNTLLLRNNQDGWIDNFSVIVEKGYKYVTRIKLEHEGKVKSFLDTSKVDYMITGKAAGFNSDAPGAHSLLYILHCVGRDGDPVISDDVPIPIKEVGSFTSGQEFIKKVLDEAFKFWIDSGMPVCSGVGERDVLVNSSKHLEIPIELGKGEVLGNSKCYYGNITESQGKIHAKITDTNLVGGFIHFDVLNETLPAGYSNELLHKLLSNNIIKLHSGGVIKTFDDYGRSKSETIPISNPMFVGLSVKKRKG